MQSSAKYIIQCVVFQIDLVSLWPRSRDGPNAYSPTFKPIYRRRTADNFQIVLESNFLKNIPPTFYCLVTLGRKMAEIPTKATILFAKKNYKILISVKVLIELVQMVLCHTV